MIYEPCGKCGCFDVQTQVILYNPLNSCMVVGNSGADYGFLTGSYGEFTPSVTSDGTLIYSFRFDATGKFIMQFGLAGDEKVFDASTITVESLLSTVLGMSWDDTNKYYTATNLNLATLLIADYVGERVCMNITLIPDLFLHFDMGNIGVT